MSHHQLRHYTNHNTPYEPGIVERRATYVVRPLLCGLFYALILAAIVDKNRTWDFALRVHFVTAGLPPVLALTVYLSYALAASTTALFWQAGTWAAAAASACLERRRRRTLGTDRAAAGSLGIIKFTLNAVIRPMALFGLPSAIDVTSIGLVRWSASTGCPGIFSRASDRRLRDR